MKDLFKTPIKGLLVDISGVLKDGATPIPGSVEALKRLQEVNFPFRLVTNETQSTVSKLVEKLNQLGFKIKDDDIFAPIPAMVRIIKNENLRPFLLLHPSAMDEFKGISTGDPNCVVIGDADHSFNYQNLNNAFRILINLEKPLLYTLGKGKYYKCDKGLTLDVGPFTYALEYAISGTARIVGKPESSFFLTAVNDIGIKPEEAVMIGDDIASDVGGAQNSGIRGVLVRTGKFRSSDEDHLVKPDGIFDNFHAIVSAILENQSACKV